MKVKCSGKVSLCIKSNPTDGERERDKEGWHPGLSTGNTRVICIGTVSHKVEFVAAGSTRVWPCAT